MWNYTVAVSERVYQKLEEETYKYYKQNDIETGGVVMGYFDGTLIRLVYVTKDTNAISQSRVYYEQGITEQQKEVDFIESIDAGIYYMGQWHKHPIGYGDLSDLDMITANDILDANGEKIPVGLVLPLTYIDRRGEFRLLIYFLEKNSRKLYSLDYSLVDDNIDKKWHETFEGLKKIKKMGNILGKLKIEFDMIDTEDGFFVEIFVNKNNFLIRLDKGRDVFLLKKERFKPHLAASKMVVNRGNIDFEPIDINIPEKVNNYKLLIEYLTEYKVNSLKDVKKNEVLKNDSENMQDIEEEGKMELVQVNNVQAMERKGGEHVNTLI